MSGFGTIHESTEDKRSFGTPPIPHIPSGMFSGFGRDPESTEGKGTANVRSWAAFGQLTHPESTEGKETDETRTPPVPRMVNSNGTNINNLPRELLFKIYDHGIPALESSRSQYNIPPLGRTSRSQLNIHQQRLLYKYLRSKDPLAVLFLIHGEVDFDWFVNEIVDRTGYNLDEVIDNTTSNLPKKYLLFVCAWSRRFNKYQRYAIIPPKMLTHLCNIQDRVCRISEACKDLPWEELAILVGMRKFLYQNPKPNDKRGFEQYYGDNFIYNLRQPPRVFTSSGWAEHKVDDGYTLDYGTFRLMSGGDILRYLFIDIFDPHRLNIDAASDKTLYDYPGVLDDDMNYIIRGRDTLPLVLLYLSFIIGCHFREVDAIEDQIENSFYYYMKNLVYKPDHPDVSLGRVFEHYKYVNFPAMYDTVNTIGVKYPIYFVKLEAILRDFSWGHDLGSFASPILQELGQKNARGHILDSHKYDQKYGYGLNVFEKRFYDGY